MHKEPRAGPGGGGHAPSDASIQRAEREETLRKIRALARSEQPDAKSNAKALYDKYEAGEMTDEQVRQTVTMLLGTADNAI